MRESAAFAAVPAKGSESVPYPTHREIVSGLLKHLTEAFVGEVVGAGGAGGDLAGIPFEPAVIVLSEGTGPILQAQLPGSAGAVDVNLITGAPAGTAIPAAVKQMDGTWTLSLPTALAPDGDTVSLLILGFREMAGSL